MQKQKGRGGDGMNRKYKDHNEYLSFRRLKYKENIEKERERIRRWDSEHREKRREYYRTHKDEKHEYYLKNKEVIKERTRLSRIKHKLYNTWEGMMRRCGHHKCKDEKALKLYRDSGVIVCDQWRKFSVFESWALSKGWRKGLEIDRVDPNGNYEPSNCRIVNHTENIRNRRNTILVEFEGNKIPLMLALERIGRQSEYGKICQRIKRGRSFEDSIK